MLTRRIRRFLATLFVGISAAVLGMLYHRLISRPLSILSGSPSSTVSAMSQIPLKPVIVVGSGLAGMSAAYEALRAGASVHMLDRAPKPGGNSIKASSGINGAGTRFQRAAGIESDGSFYDDTIRSAGARFRSWTAGTKQDIDRQTLIEMLTNQSERAVSWLVDEIGVDLSVVAPLGGHTVARTHRGSGTTPPGAAIVTTLLKKLKEHPKFQLSNLADVTSLEFNDGRVNGVRYIHDGHPHLLEGPVVFAAGGFAGDANGLLSQYRPDLSGMPSTNEARAGSHGILTDVGAELVDMDSVQIHPTGFIDRKDPVAGYKFLAAEVLRGEGGILLSPSGKRFVNEMETREVVSKAIMDLPSKDDGVIKQWEITILLDPGAGEAVGSHLGFYLFKGLMEKMKVKDLNPAMIAAVDKYAAGVAAGRDDEFGRGPFGHWRLQSGESNRDEEVCIGKVTPIVHFTMGGASFNEKAQVLASNAHGLEPIQGIYAAGEITGGIHGDNRLGGSSLLECVVFGRIAGQEAVKQL